MAPISLATLTNPLVTPNQLINFKNNTTEQNISLNFAQSLLTYNAGILLRLPQETIGAALVLIQRYQVSSKTQSTEDISRAASKFDSKLISMAVLYTTAKLSFTPLSPRSVVNVYAYLTSKVSPLWFVNPAASKGGAEVGPNAYYVTEGTYEREKMRLFSAETCVLATLGFDTHVVLPHLLALTYLQALGTGSVKLAKRVMEHLNGGLLSPQLIYLTHQPNALAVAAIYLAAREVEVKLVEENWWEVFDVDREDLGFLVLAFGSLGNYAKAELENIKDTGNALFTAS